MMTSKQPKSQKIATEQPESQPLTEPLTEHKVNKKPLKKPSTTKTVNTTEVKEAVEIPEKEAENSIKKRKSNKEKVIRDSFSFPEHDYLKISELKQTCLAEGIHVKKGELLRAGLQLLTKLSLPELKQAIEQVEKVKTGRPNSSKK
jgi:hypothetical protein